MFPTPEIVAGASALSLGDNRAFLWSPYKRKDELFEVVVGTLSAVSVGSYPGPLRGLPGGRFLASGSSGYTMISMID